RSSTTARSKFGSARAGVATSNRPVSEDTSVMPDMISHLTLTWGGNAGTNGIAAQGSRKRDGRTISSGDALWPRRSTTCCGKAMTRLRAPRAYGRGVGGHYPFTSGPAHPHRNARYMTVNDVDDVLLVHGGTPL